MEFCHVEEIIGNCFHDKLVNSLFIEMNRPL